MMLVAEHRAVTLLQRWFRKAAHRGVLALDSAVSEVVAHLEHGPLVHPVLSPSSLLGSYAHATRDGDGDDASITGMCVHVFTLRHALRLHPQSCTGQCL